MTRTDTQARWRTSSYSAQTEQSACVEVAPLPHAIGVRDSKLPTSPVHEYASAQWADFVAALKDSTVS